MPTPSITFNQVSGGTNGSPSYFDISISGSSYSWLSAGGVYDAWCLNPGLQIPFGTTFTAYVYSSLEVGIWGSSVSTLSTTAKSKLDEINWVLNYYDDKVDAALTYGDVQAAMWTLAGYAWASEAPYIGPYSQTRVNNLVAAANTHDGYVPSAGDPLALVMDPHKADGSGSYQPIIVTVKAAALGDYVWEDSNANGVQDSTEKGIAGTTVNLVRDLNGDGTITSNEILATTTTDANGHYQFNGLTPGFDYQVQFTTPTGYTNASPRQADGSAASGTNSDGALSDVVQLKPGEYNPTLDSGFYKLASLGDRVWNDSNGNGQQDAGETGRSGIKVELYTCAVNGQLEALVSTTTTDANGNYLFDNLKPGTYHVKFYAPVGTSFTTVNVGDDALDSDANSSGISGCYALNSGDHNSTVDAGLVPLGSLGDRVWIDTNGNGQQDAGEVGKAGVTVQLLDGTGVVIGTQTTDANGNYLFNNLAAGTYSVQFGSTAGYKFTTADSGADATDSDANASTGKTGAYTLGVGENNLTVDAGLLTLSALGDRVWYDTNRNGIQDTGEVGKAGVYVSLYNAGADGAIGTADDAWLTYTITDANGNYLFNNLSAGKYAVWVADGWGLNKATDQLTVANAGSNDAADADISKIQPDGISGYSDLVNLGWGETNLTVDIGIVDKLGALGDRVWYDANRNGIQDAGEKGLAGVYVNLFSVGADGKAGTGDDVWVNGRSEITDANGNYLFTNLAAGSYYARVYNGWGLDATKQQLTLINASGNEATDSDINRDADGVGGYSDVFTIGKGETNLSLDIGIVDKLGSLGDRVWIDTNGNGQQDAGEVGKSGVTVQLLNSAGTVLATQTTDANGNYLFNNLAAATYSVQFASTTGYKFTTADSGSDAIDSDANASTGKTGSYTLGIGEDNLTVDAGIYQGASLGDKVWNDTNGNGKQDAGEAGRSGVKVELYNCGTSVLVATTTTDASGNYLFSDLKPGTYHVKFYAPTGTVFTTVDVGDDALDSDAKLGGVTGCYTLNSGDKITTVDAGLLTTTPDTAKVCEDRSTTFNVLTNDSTGLKLVGVAHETSALDSTFQSNGGALSFTADGQVTYKTMGNYYGYDKLVYTVEDAAGNRTTQTVDLTVNAVSDAPTTNSGPGKTPSADEYDKIYNTTGGVKHWLYTIKLEDLGTFGDKADALQQFGTYNANVADDVDTIKSVVITGLKTTTGTYADLWFGGKVLDFSKGQTYTYSLADINAGKLQIDMQKVSTKFIVGFEYIDTGSVTNTACYNGEVTSNEANAAINSPTPIALDLNGDGKIGVTGATSSYQKDANAVLGHTVQFDIDGDGKPNTIEWFDGSGDGILIDNRDGNAAHDMSGLRLFGDQGSAYGNGYYKLDLLDTNGDHKLSGDELKGIELWVDNGDAVAQSGEIRTLADFGITEISSQLVLSYDSENKLHIGSTATRADGSKILTEDVFFAAASDAAPALRDLVSDEAALAQMLDPQHGKAGLSVADQASSVAAPQGDNSSHAEFAAASEAAQILRHLIGAHHGVMEAHAA